MALDLTCVPTIREELVRLRKADNLPAIHFGLLAHEAAGRSAQPTSARAAAPSRAPSQRHWPSRLVHAH
jgi:hypothetical protein